MKKLLAVLIAMFVVPMAFAVNIGSGITPDIGTEDFEPLVWQCDSRLLLDDATEPGRVSGDGEFLIERVANYAFEGEQIVWTVLVLDKNGIEKVSDVFGTIGSSQGAGNDIEVNCNLDHVLDADEQINPTCNARILEEVLYTPGYDNVAAYYTCIFTVETPDSHYGEHWITIEAEDLDGLSGTMDENEYWFLNPVIALSVDGDLTFEDVRPGTSSYSETLLVGNDADLGSGVVLDMFISGTDFYDSSSSGAKCPVTNQLSLSAFNYYAANGAFTTQFDARSDVEGYVPIGYGIGFNDPNPFYGTFNGDTDGYEIIQSPLNVAGYFSGNLLTPGAEQSVTFRLNLPEPCNGDFDTGAIYFWGEAI